MVTYLDAEKTAFETTTEKLRQHVSPLPNDNKGMFTSEDIAKYLAQEKNVLQTIPYPELDDKNMEDMLDETLTGKYGQMPNKWSHYTDQSKVDGKVVLSDAQVLLE